jgi:hypothetical protein
MISEPEAPKFEVKFVDSIQESGYTVYGHRIYVHSDIGVFPSLLESYLSQYMDQYHIPEELKIKVAPPYPLDIEPAEIKNGSLTFFVKNRDAKNLSQEGEPKRRRFYAPIKETSQTNMSAKRAMVMEMEQDIELTLHSISDSQLLSQWSLVEDFLIDSKPIFD